MKTFCKTSFAFKAADFPFFSLKNDHVILKNCISRRGLLREIHKIVGWSKIFKPFLICKLTTNSMSVFFRHSKFIEFH